MAEIPHIPCFDWELQCSNDLKTWHRWGSYSSRAKALRAAKYRKHMHVDGLHWRVRKSEHAKEATKGDE